MVSIWLKNRDRFFFLTNHSVFLIIISNEAGKGNLAAISFFGKREDRRE